MKNIKKLWTGILLAGSVFVLNGCYYDEVLPVAPAGPDVAGEVSFASDIIPIFNAKCNAAGCHNGAVAPDLRPDKAHAALLGGNYINTADPKSSELYLWMTGKKKLPMPLSGPDPEANAKVLKWIEQGALNN